MDGKRYFHTRLTVDDRDYRHCHSCLPLSASPLMINSFKVSCSFNHYTDNTSFTQECQLIVDTYVMPLTAAVVCCTNSWKYSRRDHAVRCVFSLYFCHTMSQSADVLVHRPPESAGRLGRLSLRSRENYIYVYRLSKMTSFFPSRYTGSLELHRCFVVAYAISTLMCVISFALPALGPHPSARGVLLLCCWS